MKKKVKYVIFAVFLSLTLMRLYGQKTVIKRVDVEGITAVEIHAENVYFLKVDTQKIREVHMRCDMEGEYQNKWIPTLAREGNTLIIGVETQPIFHVPNDKLSAHKVVSTSLHLKVPEGIHLRVSGGNTEMVIKGGFGSVSAKGTDKPIYLQQLMAQNIEVQTLMGGIYLQQCRGQVKTATKYGEVIGENIDDGNSYFDLKSLTGNIYLRKTE